MTLERKKAREGLEQIQTRFPNLHFSEIPKIRDRGQSE